MCSAQSPPTSWENRKRRIADPGFVYRAYVLPELGRQLGALSSPANRIRFKGIRCNNAYFDLVAFGTFEQPVFETDRTCRNAFKHHPRLATRAASALNIGQEWVG
jgi:hypothetical protein